jgi:hypothetical protein
MLRIAPMRKKTLGSPKFVALLKMLLSRNERNWWNVPMWRKAHLQQNLSK